jgi:hypothetical protein
MFCINFNKNFIIRLPPKLRKKNSNVSKKRKKPKSREKVGAPKARKIKKKKARGFSCSSLISVRKLQFALGGILLSQRL